MSIHVNIGEAKTHLSRLIAAALRGEKVVIDRDGKAQVELTPVAPDDHQAERRARLKAFMGSKRAEVTEQGLDLIAEPSFSDEELDALQSPRALG
jgi:antitoxin (DNA-binding transcriptional repressor) of toxin-antitoxin stability system